MGGWWSGGGGGGGGTGISAALNPPRHVTLAPVELNQQRADGTQLSPDAAAKPSVFIVLLLAVALVCRRLPQRHAAPFIVFAPSDPPFSSFDRGRICHGNSLYFTDGWSDKVLSGRTSPVLPVNSDLQLAVLVEGRSHLQGSGGTFGHGGTQRGYLLLL